MVGARVPHRGVPLPAAWLYRGPPLLRLRQARHLVLVQVPLKLPNRLGAAHAKELISLLLVLVRPGSEAVAQGLCPAPGLVVATEGGVGAHAPARGLLLALDLNLRRRVWVAHGGGQCGGVAGM